MKKIILFSIIAIGCSFINSRVDKENQSMALKNAINEFYKAIENGDGEMRAEMFTKNAIMMPNHWKLIQGKPAIKDVILSGEGMVFKIKDLDRLELSISDSMAYACRSSIHISTHTIPKARNQCGIKQKMCIFGNYNQMDHGS